MIEEKDLNTETLNKAITELLNNKAMYDEMSNNLKKLSINNSSTIIYEEIKKVL